MRITAPGVPSLAFVASAALVLSACSGTNTQQCGPSNCNGCCDAMGACQGGNTPLACGVSGAACTGCQLGDTCTFGQCTSGVGQGGGSGGGAGGGGATTGGGGGATTGGGGGATTGGGGGATTGGGGGATTGGGGGATGGGGGSLNPCAGTLQLCVDRCLDLQADPENCGRCGNLCGQGQVCNHGQCGVLPDDCTTLTRGCGAGYFCDPVSKKCMGGCRFTNDCPMGGACNGGVCSCPSGQHACGQACVADDAPASCGSRCSACAQPAHSTASCSAATCAFTCNAGYRLESGLCVDVDECATNNGGCSASATCTNTDGARTCACNAGFTGDGVTCTDVNECATNNGNCSTNATCTNTPGARTCTCNAGFTGDGTTCADVDECLTNNGGCAAAATCGNTPGARTCTCNAGYTGNGLTCTDVNECATNNGNCTTNATCTNTPGARTCACNAGYTGDGVTSCTDVNECLTNNGGCATNATCANTPGSRTCTCSAGYTGNGLSCTDVNECATNNGGCAAVAAGGVCTNTPGSRTCACAAGYTGDGLTCADVNECATNNGGCAAVAAGGVCTNTPGARTCACAAGYTGTGLTCADVNECLTNNGGCAAVAAGGVCTNTAGSRTCTCASGYTGNGTTCADVNECLTNNGGCAAVASGGVCANTVGSRTCTCAAGYAGNGLTCTPNGDTCAAPVVLSLGVTFSGTTVGATNDLATALSPLCGDAVLAAADTVHVFTPATTGAYRVAVTGFGGVRAWLSTTCGATASCQASQPEYNGATGFTFRGTAGTPVYVAVDSTGTTTGAYTLTVSAATTAANDTCATALPLTLGTPVSGTVSNSNAINDVTPLAACGNPQNTQPELVYVFTPTVSGNYVLRETTASDMVFWVSATCDGACVAYTDDPETLQMTLTAGTPYFFFIEPYTSATSYTLQLDLITVPANDTCAAPTVLPASTTVTGSTLGATNDYNGPLSLTCSGVSVPGADVVYSFTPATTSNFVVTTMGALGSWVSATCGDVNGCQALGSGGTPSNFVFRGTAGVPSYIVVDDTVSGTDDFSISVIPVAAPPNDTCATAQALTLGTPFSGTTAGAVDDLNPVVACGPSRRAGDVMFSFTPSTTGAYLVRETTSSDVVLWVSSTCDGTCTTYVDDPEEVVLNLTAGVPVLLFLEPRSQRGPYTVEVVPGVPPANDTCAAPQALSLGVTASGTVSVATNDYSGTLSAACGGLPVPGRDVVYSFTPATSGNFAVTTTGAGWAPATWISPTCGQTTSCTWASSSATQTVRGTAATPLFITVDADTATEAGSFNLLVTSVAAPANDLCATATPLTVGTAVNATTVGAVNDVHPQASCANVVSRRGEVMFSFTPPTTGTWVFHETTASDVLMWVSTACDGTCVGFVDDPENLSVTLTAGVTYYLFVEPYTSPGPISVNVNTF